MHDKRNLLSVGRDGNLRGARIAELAIELSIDAVGGDTHAHLAGLLTLAQGVELAVVAKRERAVVGACEEAHGVALEVGELLLGRAVHAGAVHVERAILLTQIIIGVAIAPHGVAVLAGEGGELAVFTVAKQPDVACDGRGVVLAPLVLRSLLVVIEHVALAVDAGRFQRELRIELGAAAIDADAIDLREIAIGEEDALGRGHNLRLEEHMVVVEEGHGGLRSAAGGEPVGRPTLAWHDPHVATSLTCRHEGYVLTVGTPHGITVVGGMGGELLGLSSGYGHGPNVALIGKGNLATVG